MVQSPAGNSAGAFPGIYATFLPDQPFLGGRYVLINTQWANRGEIVAVDLKTKEVAALSRQDRWPGTWTLLGCNDGGSSSQFLRLLPGLFCQGSRPSQGASAGRDCMPESLTGSMSCVRRLPLSASKCLLHRPQLI